MIKTLILAGAASVLITAPALAQGVAVPGVPINGEASAVTGSSYIARPARAASGEDTTHASEVLREEALSAAESGTNVSATVPRPLRVGEQVLDRYGLDAGRITDIDGSTVTLSRKGMTTQVAASSLDTRSDLTFSSQWRPDIWKR